MFLKKNMVLHWTLGKLVEVSRVTWADRVDISNWLSSFRSQQYDKIQLNPFHQHFKSHFESALPNRATGSKLNLAGGFKPFLFSISYMGCHPSHWQTPSFFKMVKSPPTRYIDMQDSCRWGILSVLFRNVRQVKLSREPSGSHAMVTTLRWKSDWGGWSLIA